MYMCASSPPWSRDSRKINAVNNAVIMYQTVLYRLATLNMITIQKEYTKLSVEQRGTPTKAKVKSMYPRI
jgi:hypothetical protein